MMTKKKAKRIMSVAQLANLKPIKKGEVRNPLGGNAPGHQLTRITKELFLELVELALTQNIEALQAVVKDPNTPSIKVGVATSIIIAIKKGDWYTLEKIIERLVGKIPDKLEVTGANSGPQVILTLPSNGREVDMKKTNERKD